MLESRDGRLLVIVWLQLSMLFFKVGFEKLVRVLGFLCWLGKKLKTD